MTKTDEKPQILLKHHLKQLKLPTFLAEYEKKARECAEAGVDHVRYLLRLSELELIERERRMVERRLVWPRSDKHRGAFGRRSSRR
jgi:DNA replication protein DnaC